jgi:cytochrome bd-type quinol oxidase subunit 2
LFLPALLFVAVNGLLIFKEDAFTGNNDNVEQWPIVLLLLVVVLALLVLLAIYRQPQSPQKLSFKVYSQN